VRPRDVDALLSLLARGSERFDEPDLDVLAHSLQCAAILGLEHPDDPELVAAGLVHDVADALPGGHDDHARRGAELVAELLGARVARLVAAHVDAKRYLVTTERGYADALSARSAQTLRHQGGSMSATEAARFARRPDLEAILALRRADERAKRPGAVVPGLDHWRGVLEACRDRTRG